MKKTIISFEIEPELLLLFDDLCKFYCLSRKTVSFLVFKHGLTSMFKLSSSCLKINVLNL